MKITRDELVKLKIRRRLEELKSIRKRIDKHMFFFGEEYEKFENIPKFFTREKKHLILNTMMYDLGFEGIINRMVLAQPPRYGKSYTGTIAIARMIGLHPERPNMRNIANEEKSKGLSMQTREIVASDFFRQMYHLKINPQKKADSAWGVVSTDPNALVKKYNRLSYFAGSVLGKSVGDPATGMLVLDDEYRDFVSAHSPKIRKSTMQWINSVHEARGESTVLRVYACTRWATDDTIGRNIKILRNYDIDFVKYFAIMHENMTDKQFEWIYQQLKEEVVAAKNAGYEIFSLSIPAVYNKKSTCESIRTTNECDILYRTNKESGEEYVWNCVFQQKPSSMEGLLFDSDLLHYYYPDEIINKQPERIIAYCDPAFGGGDNFTLIIGEQHKGKKIFITDVIYSKEETKKTQKLVLDLFKKKYVDVLTFEKNNGGGEYANGVKDLFRKNGIKARVKTISHSSTSKEGRIYAALEDIVLNFNFLDLDYISSERHLLLQEYSKNKANFDVRNDLHKIEMMKRFILDVLAFPAKVEIAEHDDCVDALAGLSEMKGKSRIKIEIW